MFKRSLFLALSLMLVLSLSAFAGEGSDTVGGGKLLPQLRYGYSVSDWKTHSAPANGFRDWDIDAQSYYAQLNWGVLNNIDLIGVVGGRSVSLESDFGGSNIDSDDWVPMFMWGLGVKGTFFRADNGFYVGGGALFTHSFSHDFDLTLVNVAGVSTVFNSTLDIYMLVPELHAGWHIGDTGLTPYAGVDYVWSRSVNEVDGLGDIESRIDHPVFMFAGIDYFLNDRLYLNVEGRSNFNDGWGMEGGIGYLFDICAKPAPAPAPAPAPVIEPKLEPMSKN
jgi:hypothetical protein